MKKMYVKLISAALALTLIGSFAACGKKTESRPTINYEGYSLQTETTSEQLSESEASITEKVATSKKNPAKTPERTTKKETVQTTKKAENKKLDINALNKAYFKVLDEYIGLCPDKEVRDDGECYCEYTLFDIDGNGVKELVVENGISEPYRTHYIYTFENGKAESLGEYSAWHLSLYNDNGKLVGSVFEGNGHFGVTEVKIENGKVTVKDIDHIEVPMDQEIETVYPRNLEEIEFKPLKEYKSNYSY